MVNQSDGIRNNIILVQIALVNRTLSINVVRECIFKYDRYFVRFFHDFKDWPRSVIVPCIEYIMLLLYYYQIGLNWRGLCHREQPLQWRVTLKWERNVCIVLITQSAQNSTRVGFGFISWNLSSNYFGSHRCTLKVQVPGHPSWPWPYYFCTEGLGMCLTWWTRSKSLLYGVLNKESKLGGSVQSYLPCNRYICLYLTPRLKVLGTYREYATELTDPVLQIREIIGW